MVYKKIIVELEGLGDLRRAEGSQRFFKTGKGQYGEGDLFLGITMPELRKFCKKYEKETGFEDVKILLTNKYHEIRMAGAILLLKLSKSEPEKAFEVYSCNTGVGKGINNWDLIDIAAPHIIGPLITAKKDLIREWVESPDLWVNRMVVLGSFFEIQQGRPDLILELAPQFLEHKHDLMHKAVGWMLREMGKRCGEKYLTDFLEVYSPRLPRTMLRYAIERLDKKKKEKYMTRKNILGN